MLLYSVIYIPVWIDLKALAFANFLLSSSIYIPVWIDLKAIRNIASAGSSSFTFQYG